MATGHFTQSIQRANEPGESQRCFATARPGSLSDTFNGVAKQTSTSCRNQRPSVRGKFLYTGDDKLWIRGVTYGTFRPDERGMEFHDSTLVERDFRLMAASGINTIRTYTVPPLWFLDLACECHLRVMAGLPWEQHVAFLDDKQRSRDIRLRIRKAVRACSRHQAILCYAIGNEIPAPIARWYGAPRIEDFLRGLWEESKAEDSDGMFTYVNYPSTEYLELDFLDLFCFNVYLETPESLRAYVARLHNLAGHRPLLLAELGLDSVRHGEQAQASALDWQVRVAFEEGCVGAILFSWTDEWYHRGHDVHDWAFGLTTRKRCPKPALAAVTRAFSEVPFRVAEDWPFISVIVCSYNGERTIRQCLDGLLRLNYRYYEVIVVDDGSTDGTAEIAQQYPFRTIRTENRGLSSARNAGLDAATGEIVAYIDDDAYPDPDWLKYLAMAFRTTDHAGVGGPNIPPPGDGLIADCVAVAPGGPTHVLVSDREAEHIPGCNMAFRKSCLESVGGFDAKFRVAGDDVDVCWRLQEREWSLGFSPAAVVWHRRRNSVKSYWKQQKGYGKAEALLEAKWPEKYNAAGHPAWAGRIYGPSISRTGRRPRRIFHGVWGRALFQSVYEPAPGLIRSLPLMPEWYLMLAVLTVISGAGLLWRPLLAALPVLLTGTGLTAFDAGMCAARAMFPTPRRSLFVRMKLRTLTAILYMLQPFARLTGRLQHGLTPWRRRGIQGWSWPWSQTWTIRSQTRRSAEEWLEALQQDLADSHARVVRGGEYDRWDLRVSDGTLGSVQLSVVIEEHGAGRQFARFRLAPRCCRPALGAVAAFFTIGVAAGWVGTPVVSTFFSSLALVFLLRMSRDSGAAMAAVLTVLRAKKSEIEDPEMAQKPVEETFVAVLRTPACMTLRASREETQDALGD